jgi:hypothetical protein
MDLAVLLAEVLWCVGGLHSESEVLVAFHTSAKKKTGMI